MKLIYVDDQDRRLFRLFLACVILLFVSVPFKASAETGFINASTVTNLAYTFSGGSHAATAVFNTINFDKTDFTQISNFAVSGIAAATSIQFESTTFTCTSGAVCTGTTWYDMNQSKVYYVFNGNPVVTSSPITITLARNIYANITGGGANAMDTSDVDATHPVAIRSADNHAMGFSYQNVVVLSTESDMFNLSYIPNGTATNFNLSITKGKQVNTFYTIHTKTTTLTRIPASSSDKLDFQYIHLYQDGLYANLTLSSGGFTDQLLNASGCSTCAAPTPTPTPVINTLTQAGIVWNKNNYTPNEIGTITYLIDSSILNFAYDFNIRVSKGGTELQRFDNLDVSALTGQTQFQFTSVGTYQADFVKTLCIVGICSDTVLDTKTASVNLAPSYITINSPVIAGRVFNASYIFGNTVLSQGELNVVIIEQFKDGGLVSYSTTSLGNFNIVPGTPYNVSLIVGQAGKYKATLFDISRGKIANTLFDVVEGFIPPQLNITASIVTTDKTNYFFGDSIITHYEIDNTNYSNGSLSKYIAIKNNDRNIYTLISINSNGFPVFNQVDTFEIPIYNGQSNPPCQTNFLCFRLSSNSVFYSGSNSIELHAKTNNTDIILSFGNITILAVDPDGYGLFVGKPQACIGESVGITTSSPDNSTIRVIENSANVQNLVYAERNTTGNNRTTYIRFVHEGQYSISLIDSTGNTRFTSYVKADNSGCLPAATATPPISRSQQQQGTINFIGSMSFIAIIIFITAVGTGFLLGGLPGGILSSLAIIPLMYLAPGDFDITTSSPSGHMIPIWVLFLEVAIVFMIIAVFAANKLTKTAGD